MSAAFFRGSGFSWRADLSGIAPAKTETSKRRRQPRAHFPPSLRPSQMGVVTTTFLFIHGGFILVGAAASETAPESPAAVERWRELLQRSPYPYCTDTVGRYRWRRVDDLLVIEVIDDFCAVGLRAKNLTKQPWQICPSSDEQGAFRPSP